MRAKSGQAKWAGAVAAVAVVLALTVGGVVAVKAVGEGGTLPSGSPSGARTLLTPFGA